MNPAKPWLCLARGHRRVAVEEHKADAAIRQARAIRRVSRLPRIRRAIFIQTRAPNLKPRAYIAAIERGKVDIGLRQWNGEALRGAPRLAHSDGRLHATGTILAGDTGQGRNIQFRLRLGASAARHRHCSCRHQQQTFR